MSRSIRAGAPPTDTEKTYQLTESQMQVVERLYSAFTHQWKAAGGIGVLRTGEETINLNQIDQQASDLLDALGLDKEKKIGGIVKTQPAQAKKDLPASTNKPATKPTIKPAATVTKPAATATNKGASDETPPPKGPASH